MLKKFGWIAVFMILAVLFAAGAAAETGGTCEDGLTWTLNDDGVLTVSGSGDMKDYDDYDSPWSEDSGSITKIVIGDGVTSIGNNAFYGCYEAAEAVIPDTVTRIGNQAFSYCDSLGSVTVPAGVTNIGYRAFGGCYSLTGIHVDSGNGAYSSADGVLFNKGKTILITYPGGKEGAYTIPDTVTAIWYNAFSECSRLSEVTIPGSVTEIRGYAFRNSGLTSVTIPASVTEIGNEIFCYCRKLTDIRVDNGNPYFCAEEGVLFNKDKTSLITYPAGKTGSYTIPNSVSDIRDFAFSYCNGLTDITVPSGITYIGDWAFTDCNNLRNVYYCGNSEQWDGIEIETGNERLTNAMVYFVAGKGTCGEAVNWVLEQNGELTISGSGAMSDYEDAADVPWASGAAEITTVIIRGGVSSIGRNAFSGCANMTAVIIPDSIESIGSGAFAGCSSLTSVSYCGSAEQWAGITIGEGNERLTLAGIQYDTVYETVIASGTFGDGLAWRLNDSGTLTISGTGSMPDFEWDNVPWGAYSESITTAKIESGITGIGHNAFSNLYSLTQVTIPEGVTTIGDAFSGCFALEELSIPASVTGMDCEFFNCSSMTAINVAGGNTVYSSEDGVLFSADKTTLINHPDGKSGDYTIPAGVTRIDDSAFNDCRLIPNLTIPASVSSIGSRAFAYCLGLENVRVDSGSEYYSAENGVLFSKDKTTLVLYPAAKQGMYIIPGGVERIRQYAFHCCSDLTGLVMPYSVLGIGEYAFVECNRMATVYYSGSEQDWDRISIAETGNRCLNAAEKRFNSGACGAKGANVLYTIDQGVLNIYGSGATADWSDSQPPWRWNANEITKTVIGDGVRTIGVRAFWYATEMTETEIPASVKSIGENAFMGCTKLQKVYYGGNPTQWSAIEISDTGNDSLKAAEVIYVSFEPDDPILNVSIDGTSYDYAGVLQLTASISYLDGSTDGLADAYPDAEMTATLIDENGEAVPGFISQHGDGLELNCNFPFASEDMEPGYYRIRVTTNVEDMTEESRAFYYTADKSNLPDPSQCRVEVSLSSTEFKLGEKFTITAAVTDKKGNPAPGVKVHFSVLDINGEYTDFFYPYGSLYNITKPGTGICSIGNIAEADMLSIFRPGRYIARVTLDGTEISDQEYFDFRMNELKLPDSTRRIEDEAFAGTDFEIAIIPDGCEYIGEYAFSNCRNLVYVRIPASAGDYPENAFSGCREDLVIDVAD